MCKPWSKRGIRLATLVMLMLIGPVGSQASDIIVSLSGPTSFAPGTPTDVEVSMTNVTGQGVLGIDFVLHYNSSLTFNSFDVPCPGSAICGFTTTANPGTNLVGFVAYGLSPVSGSGLIARFRFTNTGVAALPFCPGAVTITNVRAGGASADYEICAATSCTTNPCPSSSLSLSETVSTQKVCENHDVTATLSPAQNNVTVNFQITSGPNAGAVIPKLTSALGVATLTYANFGGVGTDVIAATVPIQAGFASAIASNPLSVSCTWTPCLSLSPLTSTHTVCDPHTVTATLSPAQLNVTVNFQITSGPNAGAIIPKLTSASGVATLTYANVGGVGTDVITATVPVQAGFSTAIASSPSNVTCTWTAATCPLPTCTMTAHAPGSLTVGDVCLVVATLKVGTTPVAQCLVTLDVLSGPNAGLQQIIATGTDGKAIFSLASPVEGADQFRVTNACGCGSQQTGTVNWTFGFNLELTPTSAANSPGQSHSVFATLTKGSTPQQGYIVTFEILSGPKMGLSLPPQTTNVLGKVTFTYTSNVAGTDIIRCRVPVQQVSGQEDIVHEVKSNSVMKIWGAVSPFTLVGVNELHDDKTVDQFVKFPDVATGVGIEVGPLGGHFVDVEAIAVHPTTSQIFAADDNRLFTIDPNTGLGTLVGPIGFEDVAGLAFQPGTNVLFGVTHTSNQLLTINLSTGVGTVKFALPLAGFKCNDMAFNPTTGGCFVLTDRPTIFQFNPATGAQLNRWNLSTSLHDMEALTWSPDGSTLYTAYDRDPDHKDIATITLVGLNNSSTQFVSATEHSEFEDIEALAFISSAIVHPLLWPMPLPDETVAAPSPRLSWQLSQSYPNPFNPATAVQVTSAEAGHVALVIYDPAGRLVRTLYRGDLAAGTRRFEWNGLDQAGARVRSGVYFCRLQAPGVQRSVRMVLTK